MPTDTTSDIVAPICRSCKYGVFDDQWGEYKCKKLEVTIYDAYYRTECEHYENKKEKSKAGV